MCFAIFINPAFNHLNTLQRRIHVIAHCPDKKFGRARLGLFAVQNAAHWHGLSQTGQLVWVLQKGFVDLPTGIETHRNARARSCISFAACQRIKYGLAGIFRRPDSRQATRCIKADTGFISRLRRPIGAQAAESRRGDSAGGTGKIPFFNITRIGIMRVCGGDKAVLQRVKPQLAFKLQTDFQPLADKASFKSAAGRLPRFARVKNLFKSTFLIGCTDTQCTFLRALYLKNFRQWLAFLPQAPIIFSIFLAIPSIARIHQPPRFIRIMRDGKKVAIARAAGFKSSPQVNGIGHIKAGKSALRDITVAEDNIAMMLSLLGQARRILIAN